jgi:hypothetical protein
MTFLRNWLAPRLAVAVVVLIGLLLLIWFVLFPLGISIATRAELPLDEFELQSGEGAAGSEDAVYYAARYTCRNTVTRLTGPAPDAAYWMMGIYDNHLLRIPGGHLNGDTIDIDEDGNYTVYIQPRPDNAGSTLECRPGGSGVMIVRVFLPTDPDAVQAPRIERFVGQDW